jgi:hypothetical protein
MPLPFDVIVKAEVAAGKREGRPRYNIQNEDEREKENNHEIPLHLQARQA